MGPHLDRLPRDGPTGAAAIGVAQELQRVFTGDHCTGPAVPPHVSYAKADRRVTACLRQRRRRGVRAGVHEGLRILSVSDQDLSERARAGESAGGPRRDLGDLAGNGSPTVMTWPGCRTSATAAGRGRSGCSPSGGEARCRCRLTAADRDRGDRVGALDVPGRGVPPPSCSKHPSGPGVLPDAVGRRPAESELGHRLR